MNSDNDVYYTATENTSENRKTLNKQKLSAQHETCIILIF